MHEVSEIFPGRLLNSFDYLKVNKLCNIDSQDDSHDIPMVSGELIAGSLWGSL